MRARTRFLTLVSGAFLFLSAAQADPAVPATAPLAPATPVPLTAPPGAPPQRFHGTLTEFDGPFLTLKTAERKSVTLGMTTATRIIHNRTLQLGGLQPGAYIGVAVLKGADGKLRAQAIRVYPLSARGQGEGEYPIDPGNPARLIVNGTVATVTPGGVGGVLTVAFHGAGAAAATGDACTGHAAAGGFGCNGAAQVQFARGVPIIAIENGDVSLLAPGAVLTASAAPDANGTLVATTITVEREAPPPKPAPTP